jgi:predicted nucleic acid-binding protein
MIIADTGFWIALADKKDKHHQQADSFAKTTAERLITTYPVITRSLPYFTTAARHTSPVELHKNVSAWRV